MNIPCPLIPPSIVSAGDALRRGELTCERLVTNCLQQIERLDPHLKAWVLVDTRSAVRTARELDQELQSGHDRGPLHGIPIGVKDLIDVAGWPTAAGIDAWAAGSLADQDAHCIMRLREAGAVILGKTVTTQLACFDPAETVNPWNHARTPGGSSSGSAVAVATGMCLGALGSQTGGSVTRPAAFCGICGAKPTYRAISMDRVVPVSLVLDHLGPMARTVADLRILLECLIDDHQDSPSPRLDPIRPATSETKIRSASDSSPSVGGPWSLGLCREWFDLSAEPEAWTVLDSLLTGGRKDGLSVEAVALPLDLDEIIRQHRILMAVDLAKNRRDDDQATRACYRPGILSLLREAAEFSESQRFFAGGHQRAARQAIDAWFEQHAGLDALVLPAAVGGAPDRCSTGSPVMNAPWSYLGLPTVSFPVGIDSDGLPLSAQLVGRRFAEDRLLDLAEWLSSRVRFVPWTER